MLETITTQIVKNENQHINLCKLSMVMRQPLQILHGRTFKREKAYGLFGKTILEESGEDDLFFFSKLYKYENVFENH